MAEDIFKLDTTNMNTALTKCKILAERMQSLKNDLDGMKLDLVEDWVGEGRKAYEKKYRLLSQQLGDIGDSMWEIYEKLQAAEEAYIQNDVNVAKSMEGVQQTGEATNAGLANTGKASAASRGNTDAASMAGNDGGGGFR